MKKKTNNMNYRIDEHKHTEAENNQEEDEANYFAACLLVPEHALREVITITTNQSALARHFGVSEAVISLRFNYLK